MTVYAVLAPPARAGARPQPERFVFIKEGFSWPAFVMAAPWLLWRRLWIVFALYAAATVAVYGLAGQLGALAAWLVVMLFGVLTGLEANNLRRWSLERHGWRFVGAASGDRLAEAEFRFFAAWPGSDARIAAAPERPAVPPQASREIVGLFPKPGGAA